LSKNRTQEYLSNTGLKFIDKYDKLSKNM